jgi:hypothetical protein
VAVSARDKTTLAPLIERMQSMIASSANPDAASARPGGAPGAPGDAEGCGRLQPQPIEADPLRSNDVT